MKVIQVRNAHQALSECLHQLRAFGVHRESRNGPVVQFPEPVTTVYERPAERVVFWEERDANPFFHFFESLWMLAGRNDVEYVARYVERMRSFSDDGVTFHGAYGYRWRHHFHYDQLNTIVAALKANPDDRRQVLSMWDARADLGRQGKDLPCNLQAVFQIACDGRLDMMVTNRSNDLIWGAYGANAVHFSYLHEYMARRIGVEQGVYRQVSANLHAYTEVLEKVQHLADHAKDPISGLEGFDPYAYEEVEPFPLITGDSQDWQEDLEVFLGDPTVMGFRDPFFRRVAVPMWNAYDHYRRAKLPDDKYQTPQDILEETCRASDWARAGSEWFQRRFRAFQQRQARAQDDGVAYE